MRFKGANDCRAEKNGPAAGRIRMGALKTCAYCPAHRGENAVGRRCLRPDRYKNHRRHP